MEAITPKDTVMTAEQLLAIENKFHLGENLADYKGLRDYIIDKVIARMQAKISFKAGKEEGRKELVEWLKEHSPTMIIGADIASVAGHDMKQDISYYPLIKLLDWQAKLKEWEGN